MIFVISFLAVSIRHIGLVFLRWQFQSVGFGIGYMVAFFHWEEMCSELKQRVTSSLKLSDKDGERFLIILYEMPEGSDALSFGKAKMVECHSSLVGLCRRKSYIKRLIDSSGV